MINPIASTHTYLPRVASGPSLSLTHVFITIGFYHNKFSWLLSVEVLKIRKIFTCTPGQDHLPTIVNISNPPPNPSNYLPP